MTAKEYVILQYKTRKGHKKAIKAIKDQNRSQKAMSNEAMHGHERENQQKGLTRPYKAIQYHTRPYKAIKGNTRPYKAIQDHTRPYKAI